ncbi:TetR/AcrR family transcriptional regulator [Cohnella nanjingensis]|uniref:TetR/AcrR family transcriptional regulator n=1 Tax=Cohnella nanjingensis TaxID=1387779 RepID=A0A7X0RKD4_9BACL|nr:TetR/AcrR family transcriptional regulator [Cohnella nanjingensis]MBB6669078.1 TetR/AcrR family transcriptional regulator [Cohnella nanjingensis]
MRRTQAETNETIRKLIEAARAVFTERGYAPSSLEEIAQRAEVTRGAVYHHFGNKKELFRVVLESVQQEIGERVEREALKRGEPWEQLEAGCIAFVTAAVDPSMKRILLEDGPAAVGWETWREMDERNAVRHLREQLQDMKDQGLLRPVSVEALTHFLSGALNEMTLWIAEANDLPRAMTEIRAVLEGCLAGFKLPHGSDRPIA